MKHLAFLAVTAGMFVCLAPSPLRGGGFSLDEAQRSFDGGDFRTTLALASEEVARNPGHERAYALLAQAYEALGEKEKAAEVWAQLKSITADDEREQEARLGLLRTRGPDVPKYTAGDEWEDDPYKVDVGEIRWERLKQDVDGITVQYKGEMPPELNEESPYFVIYSCTKRMAEVAAMLCEKYAEFLMDKYFVRGQEWALRVPIVIYKDHNDYVNVGKHPSASAGVTYSDPRTGVPKLIALYMLDEGGQLDHDAMEGTLPHELTHMVVHEWFGGAPVPRWIDEGLARRMEQTRKHYEEAAKVGREAVAGEYYRFRDLFSQEQYPHRGDRTWRFYEQSATIVLYLLEQGGPDSATAFFKALKNGKSHDDAAAGALGIPVEGAVEEFERRWVEWARNCYIRFGEKLKDGEVVQGGPLDDGVFAATFSELATVEAIKNWHAIRTDSLKPFKDLGDSYRYWKAENDQLQCDIRGSDLGSTIGIRTDDEPPMVLRCKVRATIASARDPLLFGFAMLDHRADHTGIQVGALLRDNRVHALTCVVADEIAVYLDGVCTGRSPALRAVEIDEDIDWPLAFAANGPVAVSEIETARIEVGDFVLADGGTKP